MNNIIHSILALYVANIGTDVIIIGILLHFSNLKLILVWASKLYMIFITANVLNSVCFDSSAHKFSLAEMASD